MRNSRNITSYEGHQVIEIRHSFWPAPSDWPCLPDLPQSDHIDAAKAQPAVGIKILQCALLMTSLLVWPMNLKADKVFWSVFDPWFRWTRRR